jgi:hypothetical protein
MLKGSFAMQDKDYSAASESFKKAKSPNIPQTTKKQ